MLYQIVNLKSHKNAIMKNLLQTLIIPLCICFLCSSCADDFASVEQSESFDALTSYYDQMNDWNAIALNAVGDEAFAEIELTYAESDSEEACGVATSDAVVTGGSLAANVGNALTIYNNALGFESPRALNRWFIEFGKHYYDLVIENRPEDRTAFIHQISDLHNVGANTCVQGCMQRLSIRAYNFARNYGIRTNVVDAPAQTHNEVFGPNSPSYFTYNMLSEKSACAGSE